jgi:small subunit ribosomal protein S6
MNNYYLTLLIKEAVSEKDRKELLAALTKKMGKVEKEDLWGERNLAYQIKHQDKAFYAHFEFSADPKEIKGLDNSLKLNEDVLRYLILKRD